MAEYIDREEAKDELCDRCMNVMTCARGDNSCPIKLGLNSVPAADVKPVVRSRWVYDCERTAGDGWTYRQYHCEKCGNRELGGLQNYCPNCGADMREGE